jgi:hypothetical protein
MRHEMTDWKQYRRKGFVEARPCNKGDVVSETEISISEVDKIACFRFSEDVWVCLVDGGMIARNPDNPKDQWYINPEYFKKNYEEV